MPIRREAAVLGALAAGAVVSVISTVKMHLAAPGQYGIDLIAYVAAADRLVRTGTPYAPVLHQGPFENTAANIPIAYLYPPPLAQLFVPLSVLPMDVLAIAWIAVQAAALAVLLPMVYRRYGGTTDRRHRLGLLLAVIAFTPNLVALYIGNVSGWVAIAIAALLVAAPAARSAVAGAALWLKLTPGGFALGGVLDRATRWQTILAVAAIAGISFALSPGAWADYVAVLPSAGGFYAVAPFVENLAPAHAFEAAGLGQLGAWLAPLIPLGFLGVVVVTAIRGHTAAWIAAAAGAYVSATGTSWDHYFAALTPVAIAVWPTANRTMRLLIVGVLALLGPFGFLDSLWAYHVAVTVLWVAAVLGAIGQLGGDLVPWRRSTVAPSVPTTLGDPI